jgi:hypothetical protein
MSECSSPVKMQNTQSFMCMSHIHICGMVMVKIHFMGVVYAKVT